MQGMNKPLLLLQLPQPPSSRLQMLSMAPHPQCACTNAQSGVWLATVLLHWLLLLLLQVLLVLLLWRLCGGGEYRQQLHLDANAHNLCAHVRFASVIALNRVCV